MNVNKAMVLSHILNTPGARIRLFVSFSWHFLFVRMLSS